MDDNQLIGTLYDQLINACREQRTLSQKEEDDIFRAFTVARNAHAGVRRKSGEPYITHPLAVALIAVQEVGLGPIAVISALLHDVVEDTDIGLDQIRSLFGDRVARIVDGVTKIDSVSNIVQPQQTDEDNANLPIQDLQNQSHQAENYRKILLAMCDDVYVIFLKLCDRLHNMRTLGSMKDIKKLAISSETQYLYIPLAHRLGLYTIKTELEELVMKYTNPEKYAEIQAKIDLTRGTEAKLKECLTLPIRRLLDEHGYKYTIKTRTKSVYSCWKKMEHKGVDFNEIYDLYAMRIIIDNDDRMECFKVYSLITQKFPPNPSRFRDWINQPKNNGYESLHTTVMTPIGQWVEIQIRTLQMDQVAEKGMAAHFLYKEAHPNEDNGTNAVEQWLMQIRTTLENTEKSALDLVEEFKETLYTKEIYLFTPKGETIKMPSGSTVLDFAFAIHTNLGLGCMGAKVNARVVPMNYILHSGEQVQIIASKKTQPSEEWLKVARTPRAKEHIKDYLRNQRKQYRETGKAKLEEMCRQIGITYTAEAHARTKRFFNIPSGTDLYYKAAMGQITVEDMASCFNIKRRPHSLLPSIDTPFLIDKAYEKMVFETATCCKPIQGDDVVGIKDGDRIIVHRSNCPVAMHEMGVHEENTVRTRWRPGEKITFLTGINITTVDRKGILQEIIRIISESLDINMRAITFEASEGVCHGMIMLYVHNLDHLHQLATQLHSIEGVESVRRI
ncbi:MAG: bifunctional (p)ppGpp synthetase/guanosine-3',5'-bis(diphosphate) 3'-pyrophosphohydrolase [Bacteroidales bacterium]|nr:bifunctional (p)ppGpp synthetase/guanosine-3',5'-bis(diphosphate) 3'-pyrophosphohydrolase [Bacteroidales bacterium]